MEYDMERLRQIDGVRIDEETQKVYIDLSKVDDNPELQELLSKGLEEAVRRDPVRRAAWTRLWNKLLGMDDTP